MDCSLQMKRPRRTRSRVNEGRSPGRTAEQPRTWRTSLFPQAQTVDQLAIGVRIVSLEVVEQLAPAADHPQQPPTRVVVLDMGLEVLGEIRDTRGEQRDLNLRRSGVALGALVLLHQIGLLIVGH